MNDVREMLLRQFTEKIESLDLGKLAECVDLAGDMYDQGPAERMTYQGLASEYAKRLCVLVSAEPVASLRQDYQRLDHTPYEELRATDRQLYWAIHYELEARYPEQATAVASWFDGLRDSEANDMEPWAYGDRFLDMIPEED